MISGRPSFLKKKEQKTYIQNGFLRPKTGTHITGRIICFTTNKKKQELLLIHFLKVLFDVREVSCVCCNHIPSYSPPPRKQQKVLIVIRKHNCSEYVNEGGTSKNWYECYKKSRDNTSEAGLY